jgi:predicted P-loop ATPase|tara:strand:- start:90 stop:818 length:729 start_codon:yes stop_codon:yes gene_type:complete
MPKLLQDYYYGGSLDPKNKDTIVHLAECLIINLDELEALTKFKEAALKEIITKTDINVRRPYDKFPQNLTRRASFVGSVNIDQILSDSTGSRRFLIHEVVSMNYQHHVDMDKVWKQAYDLYQSGFTYYFDQKEIDQINERNSSFEIIKPEEELLWKTFRPYKKGHGGVIKKTATEILKAINDDRLPGNSRGEAIKLGLALAKFGFEYVKIKNVKYYLLRRPTYHENLQSSYSDIDIEQDRDE